MSLYFLLLFVLFLFNLNDCQKLTDCSTNCAGWDYCVWGNSNGPRTWLNGHYLDRTAQTTTGNPTGNNRRYWSMPDLDLDQCSSQLNLSPEENSKVIMIVWAAPKGDNDFMWVMTNDKHIGTVNINDKRLYAYCLAKTEFPHECSPWLVVRDGVTTNPFDNTVTVNSLTITKGPCIPNAFPAIPCSGGLVITNTQLNNLCGTGPFRFYKKTSINGLSSVGLWYNGDENQPTTSWLYWNDATYRWECKRGSYFQIKINPCQSGVIAYSDTGFKAFVGGVTNAATPSYTFTATSGGQQYTTTLACIQTLSPTYSPSNDPTTFKPTFGTTGKETTTRRPTLNPNTPWPTADPTTKPVPPPTRSPSKQTGSPTAYIPGTPSFAPSIPTPAPITPTNPPRDSTISPTTKPIEGGPSPPTSPPVTSNTYNIIYSKINILMILIIIICILVV